MRPPMATRRVRWYFIPAVIIRALTRPPRGLAGGFTSGRTPRQWSHFDVALLALPCVRRRRRHPADAAGFGAGAIGAFASHRLPASSLWRGLWPSRSGRHADRRRAVAVLRAARRLRRFLRRLAISRSEPAPLFRLWLGSSLWLWALTGLSSA